MFHVKHTSNTPTFYSLESALLDVEQLFDLRHILKTASQSPLYTHRERDTAMTLIPEIDAMLCDLGEIQ